VREGQEKGNERFAAYCEFVGNAYRSVAEEAGTPLTNLTDMNTGKPPIAPEPSDFDSDVRSFLGRLIISEEIFDPAKLDQLYNALVWLGIVLRRHITHYEKEQPEVVPRLTLAMDCIKTMANYCETAIEQSQPLRFTC
jgi:hypothetical protein